MKFGAPQDHDAAPSCFPSSKHGKSAVLHFRTAKLKPTTSSALLRAIHETSDSSHSYSELFLALVAIR